MHKRIPLAKAIGLALLLMGIVILQGCSSDDSAASDANSDYPYLTAQPTASPSTVANGESVSYTVFATGPLGLGAVTASLSPYTSGTGFGNQASATLTETGTDTWTGSGTIDDSTVALLLGGEGYYVFIQLDVDSTFVDGTGTDYSRATSGTNYTYSYRDSSFAQVSTGSSAYEVARVTVQ